ncbi:MAG: Lipid A biosynthesis lauroyltransferase [Planctomycetes bacterium]|nr:Lipid A biosynthesis lauroyltransferase [Planctomycetota bacterium]
MTADAPTGEAAAPAARRVTLRHRAEYAAIRLFAGAVRLLGVRLGVWIARRLARLYWWADARHRRVASSNIRERMGLSADEARRLALESFRHLFTNAVEMLHFDREVARRGFDAVVVAPGAEAVGEALARGKGVIVVSGHLGNWEVIARVFARHGWPISTVYRSLDNPLLDAWVATLRSNHGQEMIEKHGAAKALLRAVRKGRLVALLVDQGAGRHGIDAPFFGAPASTIPTPAELALRTGAAIIVGVPARIGPGFRHEFRLSTLEAAPTGDHEADVLRVTTEINRRLEDAIRARPEQWLWAHRRWKRKPDDGTQSDVTHSDEETSA